MRVFEFEAINSTNIFLKELENKKNYDLVISETQILGKGRRGNNWDSKRGGAYFSFILKEDKNISTDEYLKLPLVIGYSLLRTFEKIEPNLDFMFKWTNDIFINNRKLSGILVEKVEDNFIIGIGINFNNEINYNLQNIGISLKNITNKNYDIKKIIMKIIDNFKCDLAFYLNGNFNLILNKLNDKNYLYNKNIEIDLGLNRVVSGIGKEINKKGELVVEIGGQYKNFNIGEIHIKKKTCKKNKTKVL